MSRLWNHRATANTKEANPPKHVNRLRSSSDLTEALSQPSQIVIIEFFMDGCAACIQMIPKLDSISEKYHSEAKFYSINIHQMKDIATKYGVAATPTFLVFKGGLLQGSVVGAEKRNLTDLIKNNLTQQDKTVQSPTKILDLSYYIPDKGVTSPRHCHKLKRYISSQYKGPWSCNVCNQTGHGEVYHCAICRYDECTNCSGHSHQMVLFDHSVYGVGHGDCDDDSCRARLGDGKVYHCTGCGSFDLCYECGLRSQHKSKIYFS